MTKILLAGDIHGQLHAFRRLTEIAKTNAADAVIQLGDFGLWDHTDAGRKFLNAAGDIADEQDVQWFFIDGNHECVPRIKEYEQASPDDYPFTHVRPKIKHIRRGGIFVWDDVVFLAMGGAFSIDLDLRTVGRDYWPEEEISQDDVDVALSNIGNWPRIDVMLTHDTGDVSKTTLDRLSNMYLNDRLTRRAEHNRKMLEQVISAARPKILFHGHYHTRLSYVHSNVQIEALAHSDRLSKSYIFFETDKFKDKFKEVLR